MAAPAQPAAAPTGPAKNGSATMSAQAPAFAPSQSAPHIAPSGLRNEEPVAGPSRSAGQQAAGGHAGNAGDVDMAASGQPQRQKCFDYHEKGFCMRGASCPYEHSNDALIPTPDMMFSQMPFMPGPPMRGGHRGRGGRGRGRGGHMQDGGHPQNGPAGFPGQPGMPFPGPPGMFPFMPPMPMSFGQFLENDPRKDFWGSSKPPQEKSNTLVITDIPVQHLSVPGIREYFSKFGGVTNVALEARSKRALVTFENNREAYQAWKSDDAVFGSRHVKVLWHRPRPGQGGAGQKALDASASLIANMNKMGSGEGAQQGQAATLRGPESRLRDTLAELEAKEKRSKKETLIAEQKVLLNKAKSADKDEKMRILGRLRDITKEVDDLDKPSAPPAAETDVEMSDKDKLDAELEKHGMESVKGRDEAELLKLHAQLAALKDKASTLGIAASSGSARYSPYPGARGSRGRGRARGRGAGGAFGGARPMSLDNRSRIIAVGGDAVTSEQGKTALREWYESSGGVIDNAALAQGKMLVTYPNREMAERALAQGTKEIPNVGGGVNATWHTAETAPPQVASTEVEMGEEPVRRGEKDEEE